MRGAAALMSCFPIRVATSVGQHRARHRSRVAHRSPAPPHTIPTASSASATGLHCCLNHPLLHRQQSRGARIWSGSLLIRLDVDRVDPENRPHRIRRLDREPPRRGALHHPVRHPQLGRCATRRQDRFKIWWRLVGSASSTPPSWKGTSSTSGVRRKRRTTRNRHHSLMLDVLVKDMVGPFIASDVRG